MRIPTRERRGGLKFNITPLIDVVFQLIIFFLAASHLARAEVKDDVQLPQAGTGESELEDSPRRMIVTISHDNTITVSGGQVDVAGLETRLKEAIEKSGGEASQYEVRLRTDRRVPYGTVRKVLAGCSRAGVTRIKFVVLPE